MDLIKDFSEIASEFNRIGDAITKEIVGKPASFFVEYAKKNIKSGINHDTRLWFRIENDFFDDFSEDNIAPETLGKFVEIFDKGDGYKRGKRANFDENTPYFAKITYFLQGVGWCWYYKIGQILSEFREMTMNSKTYKHYKWHGWDSHTVEPMTFEEILTVFMPEIKGRNAEWMDRVKTQNDLLKKYFEAIDSMTFTDGQVVLCEQDCYDADDYHFFAFSIKNGVFENVTGEFFTNKP